MNTQSFILFPDETAWRLASVSGGKVKFASVPITQPATPAAVATQVAAKLHQAGYTGGPTVLAIPSTWCFVAGISIDDLPKNDRNAMLFRLEEKMPIAAEALIADFLVHTPAGGHPARALGVCARIDALRPIVDALESAGVFVRSISPAVLLAAQEIAGDEAEGGVLLCGEHAGEESRINLLGFDHNTLVSWAILPPVVADVKLQLDMMATEQTAPRARACDIDPALVESLADASSLAIESRDGSMPQAAARFAAQVSAGTHRPWIEFRQGVLSAGDSLASYRKPLNFALAAALALLVISGIAMAWRTHRYDVITATNQQKMIDDFHQTFPTRDIPINVKVVLEAETRAAAKQGGSGLPEEASQSALRTLNDALKNLPADAHINTDTLIIQESFFDMQGRVRAYQDIDTIAAAIRNAGFDVTVPQARRDEDKYWSFTLHGARPAKPS